MPRRRVLILLGVLASLGALFSIVNPPRRSLRKRVRLWLTTEKFYQIIEGESIALPDGGWLSLHKDRIDLLRIEPEGDGEEPGFFDVSFVVRSEQGSYRVQGVMSLQHIESLRLPMVNLGKGWNVSKE